MLLEMLAQKYDEEDIAEMPPLYHYEFYANGEVTVDMNGNFIKALMFSDPKQKNESGSKKSPQKKSKNAEQDENKENEQEEEKQLPPGYSKTMCPCYTSKRTGSQAHARGLCDSLKYMHVFQEPIGDEYEEMLQNGCSKKDLPKDIKKIIKKNESLIERNNEYMSQLKGWCEDGATDAVKAVYRYLEKDTIVHDIFTFCNADEKQKDIPSEDKLSEKVIRFIVQKDNAPEPELIRTWTDKETIQSFITHKNNLFLKEHPDDKIGYDFITGKQMRLTNTPIANARYAGDGAMLIAFTPSEKNIVYEGKFPIRKNSQEDAPATIGEESLFKAINELKRLCWKFGIRIGNQSNSTTFLAFTRETGPEADEYCSNLRQALLGYKPLKSDMQYEGYLVELMDLNNGFGNIDIPYYAYLTHDTFDNINRWYQNCVFVGSYDGNETRFTPPLESIILCTYGYKDTAAMNKLKLSVDPKVLIAKTEAMITTLVEGKPLSKPMITQLMNNFSNINRFENKDMALKTAAAVIRKYYSDRGIDMNDNNAIVPEFNNADDKTSYILGELAAVMHTVEAGILKQKNVDRPTNIERNWSSIMRSPGKTLMTMHGRVLVYLNGAKKAAKRKWYEKLVEEKVNKIGEPIASIKKLTPAFLLGYARGKEVMYTKKKEEPEVNAETQND